jgi:outer membrane protein OmpA-like peptidoglycan-associated protein
MQRVVNVAAIATLAVVVLSGCATRGQLRTAMAEQRAEFENAVAAERSERIAADERLAADLATLRSDLQSLRTDFGARIEAVANALRFTLPVHFAFDDASVRPEDTEQLERFAEVISRHYMGAIVTIEGFADPAGPVAYNVALSQRRADAVRDYLIQAGITAQLRTIGYGEERQVVPGAERDDPGAELNRRVVFVVESPGGMPAVTALDLSDS